MRTRTQHLSMAALALLGAFGMTTSQENADLTARVTQLEAEVEAIHTYLGAQASSAEALEAALAASEEAGFASGINPRSRRILLDAWTAQAKAATSNVPGQVTEVEEVDPRDRRRRRK